MLKTTKNLSISKIKKVSKSLTELRESLRFKKIHSNNIDSVYYQDLDNHDYDNDDYADYDDDEFRKIGSIRKLFKDFDNDYYKPIITDVGRAGRNDNYIE